MEVLPRPPWSSRTRSVRLFIGGREWRLRAPSHAQFIKANFSETGYPASACRIIDGPDGSCICYVDVTGHQAWLVRLRDSKLEPLPEPPPIDPVTGLPTKDRVRLRYQSTHRTRQLPLDIEVVGESLADLLSRALAIDGELPPAVTTLAAKFAGPASWQHPPTRRDERAFRSATATLMRGGGSGQASP